MVLILTFFCITVATFFLSRRTALKEFDRATADYRRLKDKHDSLRASFALLEADTSRLKHALDEIQQLYEITKEITGFLDQEKMFAAFNEKIRRFLALEDCQLVPEGFDMSAYRDYGHVTLAIGKSRWGNLVVKGLKEKDMDKFHILAQQFLLALKRAVLYQRLQELATTDSLTHVFSRRYWSARALEEVERSRKFQYSLSCLMIDIDHFKELNDTYGHLVGDAILVAVAKIIKENVRQIDLLGKYGGEEFCALLAETEAQGAQFVAERIRQAIQDIPIQAYDETLRVTISIGIAGFPSDAQDLALLVDKADKALYQAKQAGRNRVCVYGLS